MTDTLSFYTYLKQYGPGVGLFLICIIGGRIGLSIHAVDTFVPLAWPVTGIAIAALMLYGYRLWPAVALAVFALYFSVGAGFFVSLGIASGATLESLAGVYFLKHYINFDPVTPRLRENVELIAMALVAPVIGVTLGVGSVWLGGTLPSGSVFSAVSSWWVADAFGILVLTPLLLKWLASPISKRTPMQYAELGIVTALALVISFFIFWVPQGPIDFDYLLFIPLTWAALRTGPRGITLAIFTVATAALFGTLLGHGSYSNNQGLFYLQIYIGTLTALFLIFTIIIEERKRTQKILSQHVEELEAAVHKISSEDEAKKDFLAILSHELRNPLSAILSSVELLRLQKVHAPDTSQLLQTIDEHVHAMVTMLEDLLDVSRISRNKLTLRKEMLSLDSLIDQSVRTAQVLVRSRGHTLSVIKPEKELFLEADPIRLEQILVNLLNNAAKYTNPNGSIQLLARREDDVAVIRVSDSGIGIQKHMLTRIFEPFFQVERGKLATEGLGVGLPLTKQLVELHGGTVEAMSQGKGHGSQFIVGLPLPTQPKTPPATTHTLRGGHAMRHVKNIRSILVVDDNAIAAEALGRLLELRGHEVHIAHNGTEAIAAARQFRPQIIILDIGLPDIDGYEVARLVQEEKNYAPALIALTGYGQPQDKERALNAGFHLHLTKPVSLKEVEAAFRKLPGAR
jgi:signal transduction histidine kinase/ActR/RegA family two-component response regulator